MALDKFIETYLEEARELLDGIEAHLLVLEKDPSDAESLNAAFRALHSLKGSSGMFGYDAVGKFAHEVEAALERFRSRKEPATRELIDAVLESRDVLKLMIEHPTEDIPEEKAELLVRLRALSEREVGSSVKTKAAGEGPAGPEHIFELVFIPSKSIYRRGVRIESMARQLAAMGSVTVFMDCTRVPALSELDPEDCHVGWTMMLTTRRGIDDIKDVFIFEEGDSSVSVVEVPRNEIFDGDDVRRFGEILKTGANVAPDEIRKALADQKAIGELLVERNVVAPEQVREVLIKQKHARDTVRDLREEGDRKTIRIRSEKLDILLNLVGELVTVQAQLSQTVKGEADRRLHAITDYVKRLSGELRTTAMEMRLIPVETLFAKLRRLVRDLGRDLGKEIEIVVEGGDTEFDKSVLESLSDPLVHLVRNSADHGVELPDDRVAAGKPRCGTVTVSAKHAGSFVRITVKDDGAGIDRDRVLRKAVDRGIVAADAHLSDAEIDQLIFQAGFSTAEKVTNVSGRGVGLDVVKTAIDQLGGSISVASAHGAGTEFILDIPLTLAIIDGFLARTGDRMFVMPLSQVESCFEQPATAVRERLLLHDGEFIPFIDSHEFFGIEAQGGPSEQILIARVFDSKVAILFDQLYGGYQTVVKPIGEIARWARAISGAAILADGGIALILDTLGMAKAYREAN